MVANLVSRATNPTSLFYMALRDGGPPAMLGWASPIRTRVKGPVGRWANWWRSTLTFSPLISSCLFTYLNLYFQHFFILCLPTPSRISAYEHASSSRSITDRLNSYNTPLGSEIGTLTLGPLSSGKHRLYHEPMSTVCSLYTLGGKPLASGSADTFCHLYSQCISS